MVFVDSADYFEGFKCYREMMRDYPDAKFILNTRDRKRWLRSMRRWALYKKPQCLPVPSLWYDRFEAILGRAFA